MLLKEFYDLLGVSACSFQSGDAVQKVSWADAAKRSCPNFVCLPYVEECSIMDGTETLLGSFGGLLAVGTIHDDCVSLSYPLYFHAFASESPSANCGFGFGDTAPGRGAFISDCSYSGFVSGFGGDFASIMDVFRCTETSRSRKRNEHVCDSARSFAVVRL